VPVGLEADRRGWSRPHRFACGQPVSRKTTPCRYERHPVPAGATLPAEHEW